MFNCHVSMRLRQFGPVGALLVLSIAGFFLARALGESNARRDSDHRAQIAAVRVRDSLTQATTLVDGLQGLLVSEPTPLTPAEFAQVGALWLAPSGLPAAAWVERVPASARAAYERRIHHPIVTPLSIGAPRPVGPKRTYYPATFVTRSPPLSTEGIDLGGIPEVVKAMTRPQTEYGVTATPLLRLADGTPGLFLVESAQRVDERGVYPGYAVLFVPASWLLEAASPTGHVNASALPSLQIRAGGESAGNLHGAAPAHSRFIEAGVPFEVSVPRVGVRGAAAALPWIVLGVGLLLAALAWVLGVFAARREKATAELDRLFTLTPDLIVVAGYDGHFKRVNPAFVQLLGYSEEEALARPYVEFVHPDDRARAEAEISRLQEGAPTVPFEIRSLCKDGSHRWIEWTATRVQHERQIYGVGRDVTKRRQAEADLRTAEKRHRVLAEEQAALRRVATLVARGATPSAVFAVVAEEVGRVIPGADFALVSRYHGDEIAEFVGTWRRAGEPPAAGRRIPLGGRNLHTLVFETQQPARVDRLDDDATATLVARELGARASAGAPITVAGRVWGVVIAASVREKGLPEGVEHRLAAFTEIVATAIANAEAGERVTALADRQAALRRVATLVAEGAPPKEVFTAVAAEVGQLLPAAEFASVGRYSADRTVTFAGTWSRSGEIVSPTTLSLGGRNASTLVYEHQQPVRIDRYSDASDIAEAVHASGMRSAVGAPISVSGRLWGVMIVNGRDEDAFPAGTEQWLAEFTGLVAAALSNTAARDELREVADTQTALRRVATLAAGGAPPPEVFAAVAEEVQRMVPSEFVYIGRYNEDRTVTYVAAWDGGRAAGSEATFPLGGRNLTTTVYESGQPARLDSYKDASGLSIAKAHARGITTGVGVPITVGGGLWGVVVASVTGEKDVHPDSERRLAEFTELLATAISNAEAQAELTASRARIVTTADETRRRIERDLHDGAQQRLVSLALQLRSARATVPPELGDLAAEFERAAVGLTGAVEELRELAQGIHPAVLAEGGLGPALRVLARRSSVPVKLDVRVDGRLPEPIEVAAYYVVSEALTNTAKHAEASVVEVDVEIADSALRVSVRDDGVGGAVLARRSGLVGVKDRVEALGGRILVESPPGAGTSIQVELPLDVGDPLVLADGPRDSQGSAR
jgi:PAS domain S-box-containing protein